MRPWMSLFTVVIVLANDFILFSPLLFILYTLYSLLYTGIMERTPRTYTKTLAFRRTRSSPISRDYQFTGLMLADVLRDRTHKQIYLKLAREYDSGDLIRLAKDVAGREGVVNRGAYFMRRFQQLKGTMRRIRQPADRPRRRQGKLPLRKPRRLRSGLRPRRASEKKNQ